MYALALVAAGVAQATEKQVVIGAAGGIAHTQFRDQQLTPLRHGGWGPSAALHIDVLTPTRLDRTRFSYHYGASGGWSWHAGEIDTVWAPRVLGDGDDGIYVGLKHDSHFSFRLWSGGSWQSAITFGAVVGARKAVLDRDGHRLWVEATLSTPLLGVVGRPGFAAQFQTNSLSIRDWMFSSLHNHIGVDGTGSLLWLRPSGSHLRLELRTVDDRIAVRHPVARSRSSLNVVAYWRL